MSFSMNDFKEALAARFDEAESNVRQPVPEPASSAFTPPAADADIAAYLAEVERIYQLARAGRETPATVKLMTGLESAAPNEQLQQLAQLVYVSEPAPIEVEPDFDGLSMEVPDTDPNNPMPKQGESYGRAPEGTPITQDYVDRFLRNLGTGPYAITSAEWRRQAGRV